MNTFRKFLILVSVSSLLVLSGCGYFGVAPQQTAENTTQAPTTPPTVVVDGMRTSYADVVQKTTPAVVSIIADRKTKQSGGGSGLEDFFQQFPGMQQPQRPPKLERGLGSGVVVSADGTILTNHHVVEGAEKIQIEMNDGKKLRREDRRF